MNTFTATPSSTPFYPTSRYAPHRVGERPVYDLPWITRAVNNQVTVPLETFLKTLLPEHKVASMDCDVHVEEIIREFSVPDLKKSFTRIFNTVAGSFACRDVDGGLPSGSTVADLRVPDTALIEIDLEGKNTGLNGAYYTKEGRYKSVWHLLAKRASDALSTGIPRNHIYGVYVDQERAYFLYYDHSAVVVSEPMNWVQESHSFWKAIYIASEFPLDRIGCTAMLFTDFPALRLSINELTFQFMNTVQASEHIIGEGISIIHARVISGGPWRVKDKVVTIKFSFIPKGKQWKYEEDVVSVLREKLPDQAESLPLVITSKTFLSSSIEGEVSKLLGSVYQTRELRVTVYAGQLYPVTNLANDLEILRVLRDVMTVRQLICYRLFINHRALNPGNILFYRDGTKIRGILIGYELSAHVNEVAAGSVPSCLESVESLPFVSPDILYNQSGWSVDQDYHRHDLVSVYYVLYFLATHYENGKRIPRIKAPFDIWFSDDHALSASTKMENILTKMPRFTPTSTLAKLETKVRNLHDALRNGYDRRSYTGDDDSIGFFVNYDQFRGELFYELRREEEEEIIMIERMREEEMRHAAAQVA